MFLDGGKTAPDLDERKGRFARNLVVGLVLALAFLIAYVVLKRAGVLEIIMDSDLLHGYVKRAGAYGPLLVIGLMAGAIIVNPIPSAPIALAAGLAYGHTWGTLYVMIGAVAGAIIAFAISRLLGHEILNRWFGEKLKVGLLGSQNALTSIVFVSRLLPFVSFDIVSYAAGLTVITWWRFVLATTVGIFPASFLLTHFGSEMTSGDARTIAVSVIALGTLTVIPVVVKVLWSRYKKDQGDQRR